MKQIGVTWECSRYFGLQGSLFHEDPEARPRGHTPRIEGPAGRAIGRNWKISPARRAKAVRRARLAMMARRFAQRVGVTVAVMAGVCLLTIHPASSAETRSVEAQPAGTTSGPSTTAGETPEAARLEETDEVVVSATKSRQPISHVTSAVEIITGEQMQQRKLRSVADALRLAEGATLFSFGGPGTLANVRLRGSSTEQVLVLIDGVPVNSATAGSYNFANLTTDNIERMEILRGNQSMMWGSQAMGGVINITTKRGRGPLNVGGFMEYGSFVSLREGGAVSGQKGLVDFSATLSRWDITNISAVNYRRGATERDPFRNWQGSGRLGLDLPKGARLEFNVRWMNSTVNFDGTPFFAGQIRPADGLGARNKRDELILSGVFSQPLTDWWSHKITLGRATDDLLSTSNSFERILDVGVSRAVTPSTSDISSVNHRIEWQHDFQIGKPLHVVAGYQFWEQVGRNAQQFDSKLLTTHAGFAEARLNFWDRVFGTAGIRRDEYNTFGGATTYRVTGGYLHKETDTKLRGSYATGFRAPTINQLFFPGFGNPNLTPEKSQGLDIGVDQGLFDKRVTLSAGYFWTRYQDLILSVFNPTVCGPFSTTGFCAQNVGAAKTHGWESSVKLRLVEDRPWIKSLSLVGQYTYTMTRDEPRARRLPLFPQHQYSAVLSYQPVDPLTLNLEFRYMGQYFNDVNNQEPMKAFDIWNLVTTYDVNKRIQGYLRVENLFDRKYEERLFFGTPGRSIFGGIRVNFDVG